MAEGAVSDCRFQHLKILNSTQGKQTAILSVQFSLNVQTDRYDMLHHVGQSSDIEV